MKYEEGFVAKPVELNQIIIEVWEIGGSKVKVVNFPTNNRT